MKIYEILDEELDLSIGTLIYYERDKSFIIELQEYLDEWNAPLLLTKYVKDNIYTIPADVSLMWVRGRIIPPDRQNISSILNTHRLKEYDEMKFLEISEGRCSQDCMYIRKTDTLPEYVIKRSSHHLIDFIVTSDNSLICFFANNETRRVDLSSMQHSDEICRLLKYTQLLQAGRVSAGGHSALFDEAYDIPSYMLYEAGTPVPIKYEDFILFAQNNIYDTQDTCNTLNCSRQNISYMLKANQLKPIKEDVKGNLYLKSDVLKTKW